MRERERERGGAERERGGQRERERERETDRQTDRQTECRDRRMWGGGVAKSAAECSLLPTWSGTQTKTSLFNSKYSSRIFASSSTQSGYISCQVKYSVER